MSLSRLLGGGVLGGNLALVKNIPNVFYSPGLGPNPLLPVRLVQLVAVLERLNINVRLLNCKIVGLLECDDEKLFVWQQVFIKVRQQVGDKHDFELWFPRMTFLMLQTNTNKN